MKLLNPTKHRLFEYQTQWLKEQASKQGHCTEAAILRKLIDEAMQKDSRVKKNGNGKGKKVT